MKPVAKAINTPDLTGGRVSNDMWLSGKRYIRKRSKVHFISSWRFESVDSRDPMLGLSCGGMVKIQGYDEIIWGYSPLKQADQSVKLVSW